MRTKLIALGLLIAGPVAMAFARGVSAPPLGYRDVKVVMSYVASLAPTERAAFWDAPSPVIIAGRTYVMSDDQVALIKAKHGNLEGTLAQTPVVNRYQWIEGASVSAVVCRPQYTPPLLDLGPAPARLLLPTDPIARMIAGYDSMDVLTRNRLEDFLDQQYKHSPAGSEPRADAERALRALELPVPG